MKHQLKQLLYKVRPYHLPAAMCFQLGYIFHTEMVYDDAIYTRLVEFCRQYFKITGKHVICTVMSGNSPKIAAGMKAAKCADEKLADRYHELSTVATLGYHGHFYLNPELFQRYETEMRSNNFSKEKLKDQFEEDLAWFDKHKLDHNGLYAAGWWFINQHLLALLIDAGFRFDFSFSRHIYFRNQFSHQLMLENNIKTGQPFEINIGGKGKIQEIQNLIGSPSTSLFQDFTRNLLKILDQQNLNVTGVVNSHDYDLHAEHTLKLFRKLVTLPKVSFFDAQDLVTNKLNLDYRSAYLPESIFSGPTFSN